MKTCVNLTNGLRIHTDGTFTPCCLSIFTKLKGNDGKPLQVHKNSIEEAMKSPTLAHLREATAKGETPSACQICWNEEAAGIESKRIRDNKNTEKYEVQNNELLLLELNLGNICNLACRSCNISASSNWKKEHNLVDDNKFESKVDLNKEVSKYSTPFQDDSKVWDELKSNIKTVKFLDLYGGEPMLMKKQWEVLKYSVDKGYSKEQYVHFNTNGTIFKEEYVELLKEFKHVDISFSLDGYKEKFDYIRYLGSWQEIEKNVDSWLDSTKKYTNFKFNLCYTVTVLNVLDFSELAKWSTERKIRIHSNMVHHPEHYTITNIPDNVKEAVTKAIKNKSSWMENKHPDLLIENNKIADFMNSKPANKLKWEKFLEVTEILDKSRNQSFKETFTELNKLLNI